ncbi:hypothetical protein FPE01S_03_00030 [Flavihumibacter petaseus NBRC 106054]|uniref:ABM domain-containing protein n=2 Tax=Flavihumibacter TaxID=1004301 RepID=A0A0E9N2A2_9BACT|nr:hypothetical protein FPE01S_03_00030 [Flavihumibacter petaseus NBRC 106054]
MDNKPLLLKLSGFVPENNRKEFVQTFKLAFSQISSECLEKTLSGDCLVNGYYHFISLWPSEKALRDFMQSPEFVLIEGAFETLGTSQKTSRIFNETKT